MNQNSSVAPMGAASSAPSTARRRIDVKALMSMHLRPYAIVKNWRNEFEILEEHRTHFARDVNGKVMALRDDCSDWNSRAETLLLACDLRDALPSRDVIERGKMMILSALRAPFDEANCRLLIGIMCDVTKGRAEDETAAVSIDMMTWRLEELRLDDEDLAAPTAAIAGAVTQLIDEQSFRPSIHEVRDRVIEHWHKLRADLRAVGGLSNFVATLDEVAPPETEPPPVAWCDGHTDDGDIPF
jgi:hypothetical protein